MIIGYYKLKENNMLEILVGLILLQGLSSLGKHLGWIKKHTNEEREEIFKELKRYLTLAPHVFYSATCIVIIGLCIFAYYLGTAFINTIKAF
jgi:hypothetical protein